MVVRLWRGQVPLARADEYRIYQAEVGPPGYRRIPGIRRIYMLGRSTADRYEIGMLTFWDSLDAIRAFAGDPVDRARYYGRDFEFLIDPPERVEHFDVLATANLAGGPDPRERAARMWRTLMPSGPLAESRRHDAEIQVRRLGAAPGNAGACLLRRLAQDRYELATLTFWESPGRPDFDHRGVAPPAVEQFDVLVREVAGARP